MMAYQGLALSDVFYLSCHLLPKTMVIGTSWGFVVAIVWVYRRWSNENAFDIMRSCGISSWFLNQPTMALALILMGLLYAITLHWGPLTAHISRAHGQSLKGRFDPSFITPGVFFSIQGRTLYVHHQPSRYHLQGVFLHDHRDPEKEFILCGQSAYITPYKQGFHMQFQNGSMHVFPLNCPPYLAHFKSYTMDCAAPSIHSMDGGLDQKAGELSLFKLWHHWNWGKAWGISKGSVPKDSVQKEPRANGINRNSVQKELNYRLFWPTLPLLDALCIPPIVLHGRSWTWPLFWILLVLHGGMMSPWAGVLLASTLLSRCIFWIYTRKTL